MKMTATYIKLQDAYASEANKVGSWMLIGYIAPGANSASQTGVSTSFSYAPATIDIDATEGVAISTYTAATLVWGARNNTPLNDCPKQDAADEASDADNWTLKIKDPGNGNSLVYTATVADANCKQVTPTFTNITTDK